MKCTAKKLLAFLLVFSMIFSMSVSVGAVQSATDTNDKYHKIDRFLDSVFDGVFSLAGRIFKAPDIPDAEEYGLNGNKYFYEGTDGAVGDDGWKLGFASTSVIPPQWRRNAEGEPDENGMNLNKKYYFGGYFKDKVDRIYDDETVNLVVMSTGSDANKNGVEDIIIFAALDGIGFSSMSVREAREATEKALLAKGVTHEDIIGFNFNVTHAHSVIDPQGMGLDIFGYLFKNKLLGTTERSVQKELLETIIENTADAVVSAYEKMESGSLYYFETEDVSNYSETIRLVDDKNDRGSAVQSFFACFLFEGVSGEKTILANIGMHPTVAGRYGKKVCADVPYYIGEALKEEGYNFVFIQGAQGAVGLNGDNATDEGLRWAEENSLSYEDWVTRYGERHAKKMFSDKEYGEGGIYKRIRATGYTIAHIIIDSVSRDNPVAPRLNVKMSEFIVPLDYGLIYLGAITGLLGFNTIEDQPSESGYGIATEIGYIEIGDDIAMLIMPGEISPAIVFGTDERFTGDTLWTGETSWSGKDWGYKSLEEYVRIATGDSDKRVIVVGIANDAIGYVFPDCDHTDSFLWHSVVNEILKLDAGVKHYEELLTSGKSTASTMVEAFLDLLEVTE
ncbi:MAG: hypothetical protein IJB86_09000 [Clostridia bacterium]|nr:hypothetical protein [Clostridia bacterium]